MFPHVSSCLTPGYTSVDGMHCGSSILGLLQAAPRLWQGWDHSGITGYLNRSPCGTRTCVANIVPLAGKAAPCSGQPTRQPGEEPSHEISRELLERLRQALASILDSASAAGLKFALALSGGLDSALIYTLMREHVGHDFPVYTVVSGLADYCEREQTLRHAEVLGIRNLTVLRIESRDLVAALPTAIRAAEVPLYNLHPVTRLLLASRMKQDGVDVMLTGDAADQVFSGTDGRNYLPIVAALARSQGLMLSTPFLDDAVRSFAQAWQPDANKRLLRTAAATVLDHGISFGPKTPRLAPEIDVSRHWRAQAVCRLSTQLNLSVNATSPASRMLWTSLGLLAEHIEEGIACAA